MVHLPGMMTGQILAGQSPQQAALYQTLILFLIASTSCPPAFLDPGARVARGRVGTATASSSGVPKPKTERENLRIMLSKSLFTQGLSEPPRSPPPPSQDCQGIVVQLVAALVSNSLIDFKDARLLEKLRPRSKPKTDASRKETGLWGEVFWGVLFWGGGGGGAFGGVFLGVFRGRFLGVVFGGVLGLLVISLMIAPGQAHPIWAQRSGHVARLNRCAQERARKEKERER